MWHVDEGTLHAFLDERERPGAGALDAALRERVELHVAECATCAARLAGEAQLRERAAAILGTSAPESFELPEFLPQGTVASAPRRAPRRPWVRLAWAASILAAVGAGWLGSALWRSDAGLVSAPEQSARDAGREVRQQAAEPAPPLAGAEALRPPVGEGTAADGRAQTSPAIEAAADAPGAPAAQVAGAGTAATAAAAPRADEGAVLGAVAAPVAISPPAAERPVSAEVGAVAARSEASRGTQAQMAAAPTAPTAPAAPPVMNRAAKSAVRDLVAPASRRERWSAARYPADADVAWQPAGLRAAAAVLADSLYLLSDAAVEHVAISEDGMRVLVVQRAPEGQVELVAWRAAEPADAAELGVVVTGADGRQTVTVQRGGVVMALRAPQGAGVLPLAGRLAQRLPE